MNAVTGQIVHLTVIDRHLAGDDEYMGWVDDLADTAGVVASLAECLTEHGSRSLAGAGESYKDVMSRWWAEEIEAARRTRELEAGASLPPPARMSLRPGDGALIV